VSLNVLHAETTVFPHILDGVALNKQFPQPLPSGLQTALGWPTNAITQNPIQNLLFVSRRLQNANGALSRLANQMRVF